MLSSGPGAIGRGVDLSAVDAVVSKVGGPDAICRAKISDEDRFEMRFFFALPP